ncbi:MAG: hypothetical protein A2V66_01145 [Ignavibacteria bacterium RBG_13_36_8]|nr:MAG: hypothetical protein A2V66_01145 [Ignavibacteria bacterium RBG_13_36_8]
MNLTKRNNGYYYIEFFDVIENRIKKVSTRTRNKKEAELYINRFQAKDVPNNSCQSISLSKFRDEYADFIGATHSKKYLSSIELAFRQLIRFAGNIQINSIKECRKGAYCNIVSRR